MSTRDRGVVMTTTTATPTQQTSEAKTNEAKTAHTPGPWRIAPWDDGCVVLCADGRRVALTALGDENFVDRLRDDARANARLIAQAPSMADLLRLIADRKTGNDAALAEARAILAAIDGSES